MIRIPLLFLSRCKKKPDIAILVADCDSPTGFNTVCVGVLKGMNGINDAGFGQLESYLKCLLLDQPFRTCAYGFLTDNVTLRICLASRTKYPTMEFEWVVELPWNGQKAVNALSYLLLSSLSELYYVLPEVDQSIQLTGVLGQGLSGIAYKGKRNEKDVVVKVFAESSRCLSEFKILTYLRDRGVVNIPTVDGHWNKVLALMPIGQSFTDVGSAGPTLCPEHVISLVQILRSAHSIGVVHRDVQPSNILCVKGEVLLNDWGSACYMEDIKKPYEGWLLGSSDAVLDCLIQNPGNPVPVHPKNDLHSLARTVYCMLYNPPQLLNTNDKKVIKKYWESTCSWWQTVFSLAERVNVEDEVTYQQFTDELVHAVHIADMHMHPV